MLKIKILKKNINFLDTLPAKQYKQIVAKIFELIKNPYPQDSKKLRGYEFYRVDIGEYRIIYFIKEGILEIVLIGNRNDSNVYKKLKQ
jgi:mRNA interferase RelE/StbE